MSTHLPMSHLPSPPAGVAQDRPQKPQFSGEFRTSTSQPLLGSPSQSDVFDAQMTVTSAMQASSESNSFHWGASHSDAYSQHRLENGSLANVGAASQPAPGAMAGGGQVAPQSTKVQAHCP